LATLTILGTASGGRVADAGCAAYLVTYEDTSLLLDCGPGTLGSLRAEMGVHALDGVFISHMHSDHFLDLVALNVALWTEPLPASAAGHRRRIPVYLPPNGLATLAAVFRALTLNVSGSTASRWADALDCREYAPGETIAAGRLSPTIVGPMQHATPDYGVRVAAGAGVLGYTGDTAPCDAARDLARESTVLLAESTYPEPGTNPTAGHTSAHELGELAAKAGCRSLIATHFAYARWPAERGQRERAIAERIRTGGFAGELAVAAPGRRFEF
jgi:ribonuclease BN (tRNA processing enzyme)